MEKHTPRASDRVPLKSKMSFGAGGLADNYIMNAFLALVNPIYNLGLGLRPELIGYATGVPRFIDALFDIWMGNISDNTRTRWGRRRPYILAGAMLSAVLLPLLWMPPSGTQQGMFVYLAIMSSLYLLAYSVFIVPFNALGFELTQDYDERTRVQSWRAIVGLLGSLTVPWIYKLALAVGHATGGNEVRGAQIVCAVLALIIVGAAALPVLHCRENAGALAQPKIRIGTALGYTFRNRSFLIMSAAYILIIAGLFTAGTLGLYVTLFTIAGGDKDFNGTLIGAAGTLTTVGAYLGVPLAVFIATRFGKREAMWTGLAFGLASALLQWFTLSPRWSHLSVWLQPQLIAGFLFGVGLQGCWVMMDAMTVDVCDEDELATGLRREGMYGAVRSLALKAAIAITSVTGAYVLTASGYVTNVDPSPDVVQRMKFWFVALQCVGLGGGMFLFALYPITRARAEATRRQLEARRIAATAPAA